MPNVFISYVRDNSDVVDKLADELRKHGVNVWLDREQIMPGADWRYAIRQAIKAGDYFIACFSADYVARPVTYMNTEIGLAVDMLQQMPPGRIWFIPVLLSECEVPDRTIGGGQTLRDLQWEPLHKDWERGTRRILKAMGTGKPDTLTIDKPIHLELIRIPAGKFLMGDNKTLVDVAEFYIGKYPVTNAQYATFVQAQNHERPVYWQGGRIPAGKENHPVVAISWYDSVAFCDWLSQATGRRFRLPTEADWEKAASWDEKARQKRIWPWGDTFDAARCNTFEAQKGGTTPVGAYSPAGDSPYGVADMAGNVWEWCSSLYRPYPYNAEDGPEDLVASGDRVLRGGSWAYYHDLAASSYRRDSPPANRHGSGGVRVVTMLAPP